VIKGYEESKAVALEGIGYVYIEFAPTVSIAIRIEERISNQEEEHSTPVSISGLDSLEYLLLGPHQLFLYYADATVYQDLLLRQHTFDLRLYREGSKRHSLFIDITSFFFRIAA
jgi:hypothetical protein